MWGHLQAVELLVNSDADIELCDNEGKTAVSLSNIKHTLKCTENPGMKFKDSKRISLATHHDNDNKIWQ